jgi:hypothetical protein
MLNAHNKYGSVLYFFANGVNMSNRSPGTAIRIGPNELSFNSVQAHRDIYSVPSRSKKPFLLSTSFYNNGETVRVLFYEDNINKHAWQRKLLSSGFNAAAMRHQ